MNCRILTLVLLTLCSLTICLQQVDKDNHPKGLADLKLIRQRWNVKNIIRDTDHIKDDMKKIASMQQTGAISNDEALFYFIRMHDFDNNDKLDGLEILTAFNHVTGSNEDVSLDNKERSSQESSYVLECIRDMIPMQIYNDCCYRENNCTITRQQNRGIDCMSRMIMTNYSWAFFNSHDGGSQTTENPYNYNHDHRFYGDVLETLSEICRRQPKGRLQNCIRSELIKRCRYSMLEDRITSAPGRWNQSQRRREYYPYNSNYGNNDRHGGSGDIMDRRRYPQQLYGNRRNYGNTNYNSRTDTGDTQGYYYPRGTYNEDSDDEDIGYLDGGDSGRYK